ncbi:MAG: PepSY domain-containing protein [Pyrinomonadaceae bacterium]
MKLKRNIAILIGLLVTLALGGAVIAKNKTNSIAENLSPQTRVTKEQARKIALEKVNGEIVEEEFEKENGKMVYGFEIKEASGKVMEVKIDAETGKIISVGQDDEDSDKNGDDDDDDEDGEENKTHQAELARQAKITMEQARAIASGKVQGQFLEEELENENGRLLYSFDIRNAEGKVTEVEIDAKTGEIVNVEEQDAEKEAAEKKQKMMEKDKKKP